MSSFLEFLKTGRLGRIKCGMSSAQFSEVMGGLPEPFRPTIHFLYQIAGFVQLAFNPRPDASDTVITTITLKPREAEGVVHSALEWQEGASLPPLDFDEFRAWLDEKGIRTAGGNVYGKDRHLVLESGVRVEFDETGLHSMSFTPKRESDSKQISVSLGKNDLELIKREAAARGLSVSRICSDWIREHAARIQQVESI